MMPRLSTSGSRRNALRAAMAVTLPALLGAGVAAAQVGAEWTEFQGGPAKIGAVADGPQPGYRQAWRTPIEPGGPGERYGLSAPVIAGDVAVAVGPEQVVGIDIASGEQAFSVDRDPGPSATPAVASTKSGAVIVYTEGWGDGPPDVSAPPDASPTTTPSPTTDDEAPVDSHLAAFDVGTQEPLWPPVQLEAVSRTGVTIDGGMAFVGGTGAVVTAVDLVEGSVAWTQRLDAPLVTSSAAVDGQVLVSLQGDGDTPPVIVSLDAASGEERWRHEPLAASAVVSAVSTDGANVFAIFTGLSETSVVAIDLADGSQRWSQRLNAAFDVVAPPLLSSDKVFVTDLIGHTRALDARTGVELWDFAMNATVFRSVPAVVGSHLLVPTLEGELGVIDVESGELVWRRPPDGSSIRALAPAGERLVAIRGEAASGFEAYEHDPGAELVREASPTTLALGSMLGAMALSVAAVLGVVLPLGRMLAPRMGPAFPDDPNAETGGLDDEQIRDPWEDEDPTS